MSLCGLLTILSLWPIPFILSPTFLNLILSFKETNPTHCCLRSWLSPPLLQRVCVVSASLICWLSLIMGWLQHSMQCPAPLGSLIFLCSHGVHQNLSYSLLCFTFLYKKQDTVSLGMNTICSLLHL